MTIPGGTQDFIPEGFTPVEIAFGRSSLAFQRTLEARRFHADVESIPSLEVEDAEERFKWQVTKLKRFSDEREIRRALYDGRIPSFILAPDGKLLNLNSEVWGSSEFEDIVDTGYATAYDGSNAVTGRVLLKSDKLNTIQATHNGRRRVQPSSNPSYLPPYLAFMVKAARELGLSETHRLTKEQIEDWLRIHWPADLGPASSNKIGFMATFLRDPDDQKGGHFKPVRSPK
jgi:hypothetical protein